MERNYYINALYIMPKGVDYGDGSKTTKRRRKITKKSTKKMVTAELGGQKFKYKKGGLRDMLDVPKDYRFTKRKLGSMMKIKSGDEFSFLGKKRKMTGLMKKRVVLGHNLM
tara:strand:- start:165 stop:497 length:333 start_codon:yes stop_codon:yes gene_type:complete